jgi:hypothetical protein
MLLAGCGKPETPKPSPEAASPSPAAPTSTTAAPAFNADENAFLSEVYGKTIYFLSLKPTDLLAKGYEVCPEIEKGWAWDFIKRQLAQDQALTDSEGSSETDLVAASAAIHLCGMKQQQLDEYTKTHVPIPQPGAVYGQ